MTLPTAGWRWQRRRHSRNEMKWCTTDLSSWGIIRGGAPIQPPGERADNQSPCSQYRGNMPLSISHSVLALAMWSRLLLARALLSIQRPDPLGDSTVTRRLQVVSCRRQCHAVQRPDQSAEREPTHAVHCRGSLSSAEQNQSSESTPYRPLSHWNTITLVQFIVMKRETETCKIHNVCLPCFYFSNLRGKKTTLKRQYWLLYQ